MVFYPHAPGGAQHPTAPEYVKRISRFYPHAPGGGDDASGVRRSSDQCFYPHAPGGARRVCVCVCVSFLSARPGRARLCLKRHLDVNVVSIRTPRRGATSSPIRRSIPMPVSIRTPRAGRATQCGRYLGRERHHVSLPHAPSRGATFEARFLHVDGHVSDPHAPGGARQNHGTGSRPVRSVSIRTARAEARRPKQIRQRH